MIAFNHGERGDLPDAEYTVHDGALIVGGGLASIDVAKIHTLELTIAALAERGIETDLHELEVKGIPKVLAAHDLRWEDLGLRGATIFYRRRIEDMPLMEIPEGADEARIEKVHAGRRHMVEKATDKYRFTVEPLSAPDALIVEDGRVVGLVLRRTRIEDGRVKMTDETFEARGPAIISSIGSIPEPIAGIPMKGELFDFKDWELGRLEGYPTLFSVGNVVTGKGNIVASRKHATLVSQAAIEAYVGIDAGEHQEAARPNKADAAAAELADRVADQIGKADPPTAEQIERLKERVRQRQRDIGYDDYATWMQKVGEPC